MTTIVKAMPEERRSRLVLAPVCVNCVGTLEAVSLMTGPSPGPAGSPGTFFVCDRCGHTMRDRRQPQRLLEAANQDT